MTQQLRGIRSIPWKVNEIVRAGRDTQQLAEDIRKNGLVYTVPLLKDAVLGSLGIRGKEKAENVVVVGCACFGTLDAVMSTFRLFGALKLDYALLKKEYCCGLPMITYKLKVGEDRKEADILAKEFIGMNIQQARELGAKRILYLCPWCNYLARHFYPDCDVQLLYCLDILGEPIRRASLQLSQPMGIAYFPGGQHRSWVFVPDRDWDLNWHDYRRLLNSVKGLKVIDIPPYCCVIAPEAIFQWAQKYKMNTIVTPCMPCYGRLRRKAPEEVQVKFLTDLILQILEPGKKQ